MTKSRIASFAAYVAISTADPVRFDGARNDFCGRFTRMKLGKDFDSDLSWCEPDNVCANIYWKTQWKEEIVLVAPGTTHPDARLPVLCEEALVDVAFNELAPPRRPKKPFRPYAPDVAAVVPLHYHEHHAKLGDDRPRIRVQFVAQQRSVEHSMLFDTGAYQVHIESEPSPKTLRRSGSFDKPVLGNVRTRYPDGGAAEVVGGYRKLTYGIGEVSTIHETKTVRELASISGKPLGFSFNVNLGLTEPVDDLAMGSALFGAARTSEFAKAAGVFAWVPPANKSDDAGSLLIGNHDWSQHCANESSPVMVDVNQQVSPVHWAVDGSTKIGDVEVRVNWIVDTGAAGLMVPESAFEVLKKTLEGLGSVVDQDGRDVHSVVHNCTDFRTRFPTLRFEVADFALDVTPDMYVSRVSEEHCLLNVSHHGLMWNSPSVVILGVGFLERVVSVFDAKNNKVGFCHRK